MAVRRRGAGYQADVTIKGVRYRENFENETAAHGWIADVQAALVNGRPIPEASAAEHGTRSGVMTLSRACDLCFADKYSRSKSDWPKVVRLYMDLMVKRWGANKPVREVFTERALLDYQNALLDQGLAAATVNSRMAVYSKLQTWCLKGRHISEKVDIERQKVSNERQSYLSTDDELRVLGLTKQWGRDDEHDAIIVLVDTGLRPKELWTLTGKEALAPVDGNPAAITVLAERSKTGKGRTIYATPRVWAILQHRKDVYGEERLFPNLDNRSLRTTWDRVRHHLGKDDDVDFVPYILRHTCASRLVQRGVSLGVVMRWMGHKNIQMTMRYAKFAPKDFHDAAAALAAQPLQEAA
jgi:integrase